MKIFKIAILSLVLVLSLNSCKKDQEKQWKVEIKNPAEKVEVIDISKIFYDPDVPLEKFKAQFPWFQGTVSDEDFAKNKVNIQLSSAYVLNADKFLKEDSRLSQYRANIIWRLAKLQSLNFNWGYNKQDFEKRKDFEFNSLALSYLLRF